MAEGMEDARNAAEGYKLEGKAAELEIGVRVGLRTESPPTEKLRSVVGCCGSMCIEIHASIRELLSGGGHESASLPALQVPGLLHQGRGAVHGLAACGEDSLL